MNNPEKSALSALARQLGLPTPFPHQALVIQSILESGHCAPDHDDDGEPFPLSGRSRLVLLPTGAGKTLCFSMPALVLPGISLIVYPLRSLLADQARRFALQNIPCEVLCGGQTPAERKGIFERLASGTVKLLLSNPETLLAGDMLRKLSDLSFSHLVIDEAHCIAQWGTSFRPVYLRLGELTASNLFPQISAFTATASDDIARVITDTLFSGDDAAVFSLMPDRPNIHYSTIRTVSKLRSLRILLSAPGSRPALVFCQTRDEAELTAFDLCEAGFSEVKFYHAGMERDEKQAVEAWYNTSTDGILAATIAFGMGVDKPDIRTVIHLAPSADTASFLQESGRASRDGRSGWSILLRSLSTREAVPRGFDSYLSGDVCRRIALLSGMGAPVPVDFACSGCDVCDGKRTVHTEGLDVFRSGIRSFGVNNPWDLAVFASGLPASTFVRKGYASHPLAGGLGSWSWEECYAGAVSALELWQPVRSFRELLARVVDFITRILPKGGKNDNPEVENAPESP